MRRAYLRNPTSFGYQPPHRSSTKRPGAGRLRFHAIGCTSDGGEGLPSGMCGKCAESAPDEYRQLLKRLDRRAA